MQEQPLIPFKVFGLQRTGTNLMVALMLHNFHVHSLEIGAEWKHGPIREPERMWNAQLARFILCVKNPCAWAVSCYRYLRNSYGFDPTVSLEFQRDPSVSFEEFLIRPSYGFPTPIHHWNQMYRLWLGTLPPQRTVVVRQEDQLIDQRKLLQTVQRQLGLSPRAAVLEGFAEKVDTDSRLLGRMDFDYYLDRQYMLEYSPCVLERINALIDTSLMKRFGYETERWTLDERQINELKLVVRPCTGDAADALQCTFDPYHLRQLRKSGVEIRACLDIGAGIGTAAAWVKSLWPQSRVLTYEVCPDRLRVLRINARRLGDVECICAAVSDSRAAQIPLGDLCRDKSCSHAGSSAIVAATSLEKAAAALVNVDLLRIGSARALPGILRQLEDGGLVSRIRWICGKLPSNGSSAQVLTKISKSYRVQTWTAGTGEFFLAERLAVPNAR